MRSNLFEIFQQVAVSFGVSLIVVIGAFCCIWMARAWILTRLKGAIAHEYAIALQEHKTGQEKELQDYKTANDRLLQEHKGDQDRLILDHKALQEQQLQQHRGEFETRVQLIKHENEVGQLRTSLFFNHQQEAFQAILIQTSSAIQTWWRQYDPETYITGPIPQANHQKIKETIRDYQLFLDPDCTLALNILIDVYGRSFPFDEGDGQLIHREGRQPLDDAEYLQPRIASLFQMKIGVPHDKNAFFEIALLGLVRFLHSHIRSQKIPFLDMTSQHNLDAEASVALAKDHFIELYDHLQILSDTWRNEGWISHNKYTQLTKLMEVINRESAGC